MVVVAVADAEGSDRGTIRRGCARRLAGAFLGKPAVSYDLGDDLLCRPDGGIFRAHAAVSHAGRGTNGRAPLPFLRAGVRG
jgi:hypothetical protein